LAEKGTGNVQLNPGKNGGWQGGSPGAPARPPKAGIWRVPNLHLMSFTRVFDKNLLPGVTGLRTWLEIFIFIFIFSIHFVSKIQIKLIWEFFFTIILIHITHNSIYENAIKVNNFHL
jgi:hypothetical protein